MSDSQKTITRRNPGGCLIYGIITVIVVILGIFLGVYFGTKKAIQYAVETYTTNAPATIPTLDIPEAQQKQIAAALADQARQISVGKAGSDFVLGENELNVLIVESPDLAPFRKQIYLRPEGTQLRAYLSIALDQFEPWKEFAKKMAGDKWAGRYLNGMATVGITVTNASLAVFPKKIVVSATTLPDDFIHRFPWTNLTRQANSDSNVEAVLRRVQSVEVRDSKVHVQIGPQ